MIQMRKARTWFAALFALAAVPVVAQTGGVAGRVTDAESGQGIATATVEVRQGGRLVSSVRTRDGGAYTVSGLAAGRYDLQAKAIGYASKGAPGVQVSAGGTATANFALTQQATSLAATTVTASRRPEKALDAPAQISVIGTEQIEARPSVTVADHVRSTPGVDVSQGGVAQSNIVARGFNNIFSGSMLMLQDYRFAGVPSLRVNVPFLFTGTNEDIERVEVLLGPASALFGPNSSNGVLHIITKSPFTSQGTTVTVDGGSQSVIRGSLRHARTFGERVGLKLSGEYMQGEEFTYRDPGEPNTLPGGPFSPVPPSRQGLPNPRDFDIQRMTGEARLDIRPRDDMELISTFGHTNIGSGIELTGANGAAQIRNWTYSNLQQRFRWGRFFAQGFVNLSNAGNENAQDTEGTYLLRTGQPIVDRSRVFSLQAQHGVTLGTKYDFTYGLDYIATTPRTGGTINGRNEEIDDMNEVGGYVQARAPLTDKFELLGALRADKHNLIEDVMISPRVAALFKPTQDQNFRLVYNRAFNTPQNFSFFLDLQSATLRNRGVPYDIIATGNAPKQGYQFNRTCTATIAGGLCMRSPFIPGSIGANAPMIPSDAGLAFPVVVNLQRNNLITGISQALQAPAPQGPGLPQAQAQSVATNLVNALGQSIPAGQLASVLRYINNAGTVVDPATVRDIAALKASFNTTYEAGWKGLLGQKFQFDAAFWYSQRGDVGAPASVATPNVFANPQSLGGLMVARFVPVLEGSGFFNAQQAQAFATALAGNLAPRLASVPLGTVTFDNPERAPDANIRATYIPSTQEVTLFGTDVGLTYQLSNVYQLIGTYGYASKSIFDEVRDPSGLALALNAPQHKASATVRRDNALGGWGGELRGRYTDAFPVNSGSLFNSFAFQVDPNSPAAASAQCNPNPPAGAPAFTPNACYRYDRVPVNMLVDAGVSYRFQLNGRNALFSINATNLLDNEVPTFVGTPNIGRLIMTRLQYTF